MSYKERIVELLQKYMTEKGFKLWQGIDKVLPDIWEKPTSSTGKYHKKLNGVVPTNAEHVYEMLFAACKLLKMFGADKKTPDADKLLFAVVLHDTLKYGKLGTRAHTDSSHDKEAGDMIASNKDTFLKILTEDQFNTLEESVRFHSGRWSTDVSRNEQFTFHNFRPETMFVHILDMLSTQDLIQTDVRE